MNKTVLTVHGHFIDLRGVELLDVSQDADVVILHEVDRHTLAAEATRTTDSVRTYQWIVIIRLENTQY